MSKDQPLLTYDVETGVIDDVGDLDDFLLGLGVDSEVDNFPLDDTCSALIPCAKVPRISWTQWPAARR